MRAVPLRELNHHTAEVMARVERGERVEVTRNGTRIAIIEPAQPNPLAPLIESGELISAKEKLRLAAGAVHHAGSAGVDAILLDRYGDDR